MNQRIRILSVAAAAIVSSFAMASEQFDDASDGPTVVGEWNTNFAQSYAYAQENRLPMFLFLGNKSCSYCTSLVKVFKSEAFKAWQAQHPMVYVFKYPTRKAMNNALGGLDSSEASIDIRAADRFIVRAQSGLTKFPLVGLSWYKNGLEQQTAFSGRSNTMPVKKTGSSTAALCTMLTESVEKYVPFDTDPEEEDPEEDDSPFGQEKLSHTAALMDGDEVVGALSFESGVANARGAVSVKGKVRTIDGKQRAFSCKSDIGEGGFALNISGLGELAVDCASSGITGTLGDWTAVACGGIGGNAASSEMTFSVEGEFALEDEEYTLVDGCSPDGETVYVSGSRWKTDTAGKVTYDKSKGEIEIPTSNPSALKLSYATKTGFFKGTFSAYAYKPVVNKSGKVTSVKFKRYTAKVTGIVIDGIGYGQAVAVGLGTVRVTLQ